MRHSLSSLSSNELLTSSLLTPATADFILIVRLESVYEGEVGVAPLSSMPSKSSLGTNLDSPSLTSTICDSNSNEAGVKPSAVACSETFPLLFVERITTRFTPHSTGSDFASTKLSGPCAMPPLHSTGPLRVKLIISFANGQRFPSLSKTSTSTITKSEPSALKPVGLWIKLNFKRSGSPTVFMIAVLITSPLSSYPTAFNSPPSQATSSKVNKNR